VTNRRTFLIGIARTMAGAGSALSTLRSASGQQASVARRQQPSRRPDHALRVRCPPTPARGPLRVHPRNPRYFTDGSGRAIYLTGCAAVRADAENSIRAVP
jgi:hypothetical protein